MAPNESTMMAVALPGFDMAVEVRRFPVPAPENGDVRVRVHTASVNGFDLAVATGRLRGMMEHRFPLVLGKDFAGIVDAVGAGVTGFVPGDRVFGVVTRPWLGEGSFGDYVTVPAAIGIARLPGGVSFEVGGALGLAGTAARMAVDAVAPIAGETIIIAGATGGVGSMAVQLAARAGARVIATARGEEERRFVTRLGAAEVVDYTWDLATQVRASHPDGVDAALHFAGDPDALVPLVRAGGRLASTMIMSPEQIAGDGVTVHAIYAVPTAEVLTGLAESVASGALIVPLQRRYALGDAPSALAHFAEGTLGKLVIGTRAG